MESEELRGWFSSVVGERDFYKRKFEELEKLKLTVSAPTAFAPGRLLRIITQDRDEARKEIQTLNQALVVANDRADRAEKDTEGDYLRHRLELASKALTVALNERDEARRCVETPHPELTRRLANALNERDYFKKIFQVAFKEAKDLKDALREIITLLEPYKCKVECENGACRARHIAKKALE